MKAAVKEAALATGWESGATPKPGVHDPGAATASSMASQLPAAKDVLPLALISSYSTLGGESVSCLGTMVQVALEALPK